DEVVRAPRGIGRGLVAVALDESLKCPRQPGLAEADRAADDPFAPLRLRLVGGPERAAPGREASAPLPVLVLSRRWDDLVVRHIAGVSTKRTATLIIEKVVGPFGDFGHRLLERRTIALLQGSLRAAQESFDRLDRLGLPCDVDGFHLWSGSGPPFPFGRPLRRRLVRLGRRGPGDEARGDQRLDHTNGGLLRAHRQAPRWVAPSLVRGLCEVVPEL